MPEDVMTDLGPVAEPDDSGPSRRRKALRRFAPGRVLRACAGVDQSTIETCWEERFKYAGMGGAVLSTAVIAAGSMSMAFGIAFDGSAVDFVIPGLVWGVVIFNLDRWLVGSAHGARTRRSSLVPRLALAVVLGIIIAEPLVLKIFQPAIEDEYNIQRQESLDAYRSKLVACNPLPGEAGRSDDTDTSVAVPDPASDGCEDFGLGLSRSADSAAVVAAELAYQDGLTRLKEIQVQRDDLEAKVKAERAGEATAGTTGERGVGPVTAALQAELLQKNAELTAQQVRVDTLKSDRDSKMGSVGQSTEDVAGTILSAIDSRVSERREDLSGEAGLLERMKILHELTSKDATLSVALWSLRLFLVAIDTMPVLIKMMLPKGSYDRLITERLDAAEAVGIARIQAARDTTRDHVRAERHKALEEIGVEKRAAEVKATLWRIYWDKELEERAQLLGVSAGELDDLDEFPRGYSQSSGSVRNATMVNDLFSSADGIGSRGDARMEDLLDGLEDDYDVDLDDPLFDPSGSGAARDPFGEWDELMDPWSDQSGTASRNSPWRSSDRRSNADSPSDIDIKTDEGATMDAGNRRIARVVPTWLKSMAAGRKDRKLEDDDIEFVEV